MSCFFESVKSANRIFGFLVSFPNLLKTFGNCFFSGVNHTLTNICQRQMIADVIEIGTTLVDTDGHTNEKFVADTVAMATKNSHHKEKK